MGWVCHQIRRREPPSRSRVEAVLGAWSAGARGAMCAIGLLPALAASPGAEVAVLYNTQFGPESRQVADYYAERRGIPKDQVIGLGLPRTETMTRQDFTTQLYRPLLNELEKRRLVSFHGQLIPASEGAPGGVARLLIASKIRYLVLTYGVPVRISGDANLREAVFEKLPQPLRRNEAAVDSELAALPLLERRAPLAGPLQNPAFGTTNFAALHPTNGIFLVARLDGPSAELAMALVDRGLRAETNGLWGRAYFDMRGLTNGPYTRGDQWIRTAHDAVLQQGFEVTLDDKGSTFPAWFPMPQIALYAGWYDAAVSGPFTRDGVEFMPGAVAYHLHSYSATTIRDSRARWVGPLVARGAAATLGCVAEPYLDLSPDVGRFFTFLISIGCTLGEAAYVAQPALSWQTTVVGDPLYRPMARPPAELHANLERRQSDDLAWSHLRVVNLNLVHGSSTAEMTRYLEELPLTRRSAILSEKLGNLYRDDREPEHAIEQYRAALRLQPSANQRRQLQLAVVELLTAQRRHGEALDVYQTFFQENPGYPGAIRFYKQALPIARRLGRAELAEEYQRQIELLTPPPAPDTNKAAPRKP